MIIALMIALLYVFITYYQGITTVDVFSKKSGDEFPFSNDSPIGNMEHGNLKTSGDKPIIEYYVSGDKTIIDNPPSSGDKTIIDNPPSSGDKTIIDNPSLSGDKTTNDNSHSSGETIPKDNNPLEGNSGESNIPEEENQPPKQIVMSSNPETSSQEKQEILSQIDEALQGLLATVSKVETVDETKLDATLNSGVNVP